MKLKELLLALVISVGFMWFLFFVVLDFEVNRRIAKEQQACIENYINTGIERKNILLTEYSCTLKTPQ